MGVDFLQGRIVFLREGDEALLRGHGAALNLGCRILFAGAAAQGETASKVSMPAWAAAKMALDPFDGMTSDQKKSVWRRACDLQKTAKAGARRESKDLERRIAGLGKKIADEEGKARKEKASRAALRASKSAAKASAATNNSDATNNGNTNGSTSNNKSKSIKPRQPSGGTRRSTRTLGFEWKAGSEVLGKDRLWRRRLSEFLSESKTLAGRPSVVPTAEAQQHRAALLGDGASPAGASSGPQSSKKSEDRRGRSLTVFVNG